MTAACATLDHTVYAIKLRFYGARLPADGARPWGLACGRSGRPRAVHAGLIGAEAGAGIRIGDAVGPPEPRHGPGGYYVDHASYTRSLGALTYETPPGVSVDIIEGGRDGWRAVARHAGASSECRIAVGSALPRGDTEREVKCSRPGVR